MGYDVTLRPNNSSDALTELSARYNGDWCILSLAYTSRIGGTLLYKNLSNKANKMVKYEITELSISKRKQHSCTYFSVLTLKPSMSNVWAISTFL